MELWQNYKMNILSIKEHKIRKVIKDEYIRIANDIVDYNNPERTLDNLLEIEKWMKEDLEWYDKQRKIWCELEERAMRHLIRMNYNMRKVPFIFSKNIVGKQSLGSKLEVVDPLPEGALPVYQYKDK
jgi:hypothetical protein